MGTKQKTVIVTGASQGIGAGVVQAFLDRGYNVVANSRNITKSGAFTGSGQLVLVDGDIAESTVAAKVIEITVSKFGSIDALVNNAGIFSVPTCFDCNCRILTDTDVLRGSGRSDELRSRG
jgi:NAD(P)-dependent dehydrogenase (short-subunit alcohol dehydrogenase family)